MNRARKFSILSAQAGKTINQIAEDIKKSGDGFLLTPAWKELRGKVVSHYGGKCMCCGRIPKRGVNVDHIKPRKIHPELALDFDNLQVLCWRCNKKKGNKHETDYRATLGRTMEKRK